MHEKPCKTAIIDYNNDSPLAVITAPREWKDSIEDVPSLINVSDHIRGRVIIIEDISASMIASLGTILGIDPMFFANCVSTEFENLENKPPPPSLALFPSYWSLRPDMLHLQYQRVVDLGVEPSYTQNETSKTSGNVGHSLRRLPGLKRRHIGLARGCCSAWTKNIGNTWICMMLLHILTPNRALSQK